LKPSIRFSWLNAELKRLIQKTTGRRPMIMPVILEI
jgi:hypothetical protein